MPQNELAGRGLFDPSTIQGRYSLLAAFLVAIEALLGVWLVLADDASERIVIGVLMTVLLLAFLGTVGYMEWLRSKTAAAPLPEGFDEVAHGEVSAEEVANPAPEQMAGPDGSYVINQPPDDWNVEIVSFFDWLTGNLGLRNSAIKDNVIGQLPMNAIVTEDPEAADVLVMSRREPTMVIPTPGTTTINGRRMPTAMTILIETRLAIIPMARARAPLYEERTTLESFLSVLSQILVSGVMQVRDLKTGTMVNGSRRVVSAELRQDIRHATVNDAPDRSVRFNIVLVGIEGDVRDYLLVMNYPSPIDEPPGSARPEVRALQELSASFRPLKVHDLERRRAALAQTADERFAALMKASGRKIFYAELGMVLMRVGGLDLEKSEGRSEAIRWLRPFRAFAEQVELEDEEGRELGEFWDSLDRAEAGDAQGFKEQMEKFMSHFRAASTGEGASGSVESPEERPELPGESSGSSVLETS